MGKLHMSMIALWLYRNVACLDTNLTLGQLIPGQHGGLGTLQLEVNWACTSRVFGQHKKLL